MSAIAKADGTTSSVPALDRALDILECLSSSSLGMTLAELTDELGVPKNSVFRITQALLARGYLARDAMTLAFRLTPQLLRLSPPRWNEMSLTDASRESMIVLRNATRETVQLGVLSDNEGVIIDQLEGLEPLRIVVDLGLRFALHNNAPGKLLLAHMPLEEQKGVLSQINLPASTSRTITRKADLLQECERILSYGYSTDYGEADEGVHCVAGPIFGKDKSLVGTLWVSGPAKRVPKSRFRELGVQIRQAGERVSRRIGEFS